EGNGDPPVPDLYTMKELCQPSLNGQGGPIAPFAIQATNFRLKNDMIQQVQNSCKFHGLPSDDANKHLDKFLHVTQSVKVNGVTDDALRLYLFPLSLTHHATAWFDHLPKNFINTFEQMAKMFLGKYFPPSMNPTEQSRLRIFLSKEIFKGRMIRIHNAFVHDEDCTYNKVVCIAHKLKGQISVGGNQDWGFSYFSFECLKGFNTLFGKEEYGIFLKNTVSFSRRRVIGRVIFEKSFINHR
nr:reverse transcriptase domain-containing protein [Tanacetum cinerariifolium]